MADPLDSHFGTPVLSFIVPLWRWRLDVTFFRTETTPRGPHGWELAVHLWVMPKRGGTDG